jgi:hypothetical protein
MAVHPRKRAGGTVYWISFYWQGKRVWERSGKDRREAERLDSRRAAEVRSGNRDRPVEPTDENKSDFIRAQPATMSAADVIAKGKAEGIKIGSSLVHMVRGRSSGKAKEAMCRHRDGISPRDIPPRLVLSASRRESRSRDGQRFIEAQNVPLFM